MILRESRATEVFHAAVASTAIEENKSAPLPADVCSVRTTTTTNSKDSRGGVCLRVPHAGRLKKLFTNSAAIDIPHKFHTITAYQRG